MTLKIPTDPSALCRGLIYARIILETTTRPGQDIPLRETLANHDPRFSSTGSPLPLHPHSDNFRQACLKLGTDTNSNIELFFKNQISSSLHLDQEIQTLEDRLEDLRTKSKIKPLFPRHWKLSHPSHAHFPPWMEELELWFAEVYFAHLELAFILSRTPATYLGLLLSQYPDLLETREGSIGICSGPLLGAVLFSEKTVDQHTRQEKRQETWVPLNVLPDGILEMPLLYGPEYAHTALPAIDQARTEDQRIQALEIFLNEMAKIDHYLVHSSLNETDREKLENERGCCLARIENSLSCLLREEGLSWHSEPLKKGLLVFRLNTSKKMLPRLQPFFESKIASLGKGLALSGECVEETVNFLLRKARTQLASLSILEIRGPLSHFELKGLAEIPFERLEKLVFVPDSFNSSQQEGSLLQWIENPHLCFLTHLTLLNMNPDEPLLRAISQKKYLHALRLDWERLTLGQLSLLFEDNLFFLCEMPGFETHSLPTTKEGDSCLRFIKFHLETVIKKEKAAHPFLAFVNENPEQWTEKQLIHLIGLLLHHVHKGTTLEELVLENLHLLLLKRTESSVHEAAQLFFNQNNQKPYSIFRRPHYYFRGRSLLSPFLITPEIFKQIKPAHLRFEFCTFPQDLRGFSFFNCDFHHCNFPEGTDFTGASFHGCDFRGETRVPKGKWIRVQSSHTTSEASVDFTGSVTDGQHPFLATEKTSTLSVVEPPTPKENPFQQTDHSGYRDFIFVNALEGLKQGGPLTETHFRTLESLTLSGRQGPERNASLRDFYERLGVNVFARKDRRSF